MTFRWTIAKFHVAKKDPVTIISFVLMVLSGIQTNWPLLQPIINDHPKVAAALVFAISMSTLILTWRGQSVTEKTIDAGAVPPPGVAIPTVPPA